MDDVTARQRRILEFIKRTVQDRGYPPTVREIGEAVGLTSSSSVHAQLANLERRGMLRRDPTKPRAMELKGPGGAPRARSASVPLLGRVSAGAPALAAEDVEEYLAVPGDFAEDEGFFALRVRGESMIGAGILDGDTVVIRSQTIADDGDIVVALLGGPAEDEATVKRYRQIDGRVMLVPENPSMAPFALGDGTLVGKVVAVLRKL